MARISSARPTPIAGSDIQVVTTSNTAMPPSQAQARPAIPNGTPSRKAAGRIRAPTRPARTAMPGRPSALVAGANRICSVISGIAMASTGTRATVSLHLAPSTVSTSGSAVTARPK